MSATNTTTNLGLSQFVNTDVPAWRQDYNGDMLKIDNAYTADISGATAETSADPSDYMKFYDVSATTNKKILISDLLKGAKVEDLTDTDITTPVDDDGLVYDSTSQKWENVPIMTKAAQDDLGAVNIFLHNGTDSVHRGITYIVNSDKSISANGTVESAASFFTATVNVPLKAGSYKLSGFPKNAGFDGYLAILDSSNNVIAQQTQGSSDTKEFTINQDYSSYQLFIRIEATEIVDHKTFKPMLTPASVPQSDYDHYVAPAMTNRELTDKIMTSGVVLDNPANIAIVSGLTATVTTTKIFMAYSKDKRAFTFSIFMYLTSVSNITAAPIIEITVPFDVTNLPQMIVGGKTVLNQSTYHPDGYYVVNNGANKIRLQKQNSIGAWAAGTSNVIIYIDPITFILN